MTPVRLWRKDKPLQLCKGAQNETETHTIEDEELEEQHCDNENLF